MLNKSLFSSVKMDWETPDDLYKELDAEFCFSLDVCAFDWNAKAPAWLTIFDDALTLDWIWVCREVLNQPPVCWMNPPYGREIVAWMKKAHETALDGGTVVCLVPSRTDTNWWHDHAVHGEIRFLKGRLQFKGAPYSAPFPSAVVIFRPETVGTHAPLRAPAQMHITPRLKPKEKQTERKVDQALLFG